jgi:flagellar biosynthesis component FlhA
MNVAEETAIPNLSNILSKLHLTIPLGVMGVLIVMVPPTPTMITGLRISLNTTLSIIIKLVSMHRLQPVHFSAFPSLLFLIPWSRLALNSARFALFFALIVIQFKDRS